MRTKFASIVLTGIIWATQAFASFSSEEFFRILKSGDYALISAGRNLSNKADSKLTDEQITTRTQELDRELKNAKFKFQKVLGHYGVPEESFFVSIKAKQEPLILKLGEKYKQESVILGSRGLQKMVYTTGKDKGYAHMGFGLVIPVNTPKDFTEIVTKEGSKIRFSLNFDFDTKCKNKILFYSKRCH